MEHSYIIAYNSFSSRKSVRLDLFVASLKNLDILAGNFFNTYLKYY